MSRVTWGRTRLSIVKETLIFHKCDPGFFDDLLFFFIINILLCTYCGCLSSEFRVLEYGGKFKFSLLFRSRVHAQYSFVSRRASYYK